MWSWEAEERSLESLVERGEWKQIYRDLCWAVNERRAAISAPLLEHRTAVGNREWPTLEDLEGMNVGLAAWGVWQLVTSSSQLIKNNGGAIRTLPRFGNYYPGPACFMKSDFTYWVSQDEILANAGCPYTILQLNQRRHVADYWLWRSAVAMCDALKIYERPLYSLLYPVWGDCLYKGPYPAGYTDVEQYNQRVALWGDLDPEAGGRFWGVERYIEKNLGYIYAFANTGVTLAGIDVSGVRGTAIHNRIAYTVTGRPYHYGEINHFTVTDSLGLELTSSELPISSPLIIEHPANGWPSAGLNSYWIRTDDSLYPYPNVNMRVKALNKVKSVEHFYWTYLGQTRWDISDGLTYG